MKFNINDLVLAHCRSAIDVYGYVFKHNGSDENNGDTYLITVLETTDNIFGVGCSFWFDENELEIPDEKTLNRINKLITFK